MYAGMGQPAHTAGSRCCCTHVQALGTVAGHNQLYYLYKDAASCAGGSQPEVVGTCDHVDEWEQRAQAALSLVAAPGSLPYSAVDSPIAAFSSRLAAMDGALVVLVPRDGQAWADTRISAHGGSDVVCIPALWDDASVSPLDLLECLHECRAKLAYPSMQSCFLQLKDLAGNSSTVLPMHEEAMRQKYGARLLSLRLFDPDGAGIPLEEQTTSDDLVAWFDLLDLPPPPVTSCPLSQDKLYSFLVGVGLLGLSCLCVGLLQLCRRSQRREIKASTAPSLGGYDVAPNQAVLAGRELDPSAY
eukprot:Transcript_26230.p2 GENE.Transcript_26230~~Transcript_26230.p2  ORF type:complete len:301 (-),score=47.28 Transcript_26230:15-917(-)